MSKKWVCIARCGSIGDNLIASSVLPIFKAQDYMIEFIAQKGAAADVLKENPYIDKLVILEPDNIPNTSDTWREFWRKRAKEYDKFYHLSYSLESYVAFHPENAAFWWPDNYRRQIADKSYLGLTHDICEVPHEYAPNFFPTKEEITQAEEVKIKVAPLGQPVIGWVISGSRLDKLYPQSTLAITRLIKELNCTILMFGQRNEKEYNYAKQVMENVRAANGSDYGLHLAMITEGIFVANNQTVFTEAVPDLWPIRRTLTTLQQCDLVITPDTGSGWAVAMRPMPKIVLLGHSSPKNITHGWVNTTTLHANQERVSCWPCHQLHNNISTCRPNPTNTGAACISDISVEQIVRKAKELLGYANTQVFGVGKFVQRSHAAVRFDDGSRPSSPDGSQEHWASQSANADRGEHTGRTVHGHVESVPDADAVKSTNGGGHRKVARPKAQHGGRSKNSSANGQRAPSSVVDRQHRVRRSPAGRGAEGR